MDRRRASPGAAFTGAAPAEKAAAWLARRETPLSALAAAAGLALLAAGALGWLNPLFALAGRPSHFALRAESHDPAMRALCGWIRTNTPEDAVFLASPLLEGFTLYARRADVVNFKQATFTRAEIGRAHV